MTYNEALQREAAVGAIASPRGDSTRRVLSAGTLAGDRVRNPEGDDLGTVEEVMIDLESGQVAYVVLSFGGFLGIGDKLFAVPWDALRLNTDNHEFILDLDKQALENAPGFDKDNWPDMADVNWATGIHSHYGREPYWKRADEWRTSYNAGSNESMRETQRTGNPGSAPGSRRER